MLFTNTNNFYTNTYLISLSKILGTMCKDIRITKKDIEIKTTLGNLNAVLYCLQNHNLCLYKQLSEIVCIDTLGSSNTVDDFYTFASFDIPNKIEPIRQCQFVTYTYYNKNIYDIYDFEDIDDIDIYSTDKKVKLNDNDFEYITFFDNINNDYIDGIDNINNDVSGTLENESFDPNGVRFSLIYKLYSLTYNSHIYIVVQTNEVIPVPSVSKIFSSAIWLEREVLDLFGIIFIEHPDLRRLLTDYGFQGYPLRKDFPLTGFVEIYYNDSTKRLAYEPVELAQESRNFSLKSSLNELNNNISTPFDDFLKKVDFLDISESKDEDNSKSKEFPEGNEDPLIKKINENLNDIGDFHEISDIIDPLINDIEAIENIDNVDNDIDNTDENIVNNVDDIDENVDDIDSIDYVDENTFKRGIIHDIKLLLVKDNNYIDNFDNLEIIKNNITNNIKSVLVKETKYIDNDDNNYMDFIADIKDNSELSRVVALKLLYEVLERGYYNIIINKSKNVKN
jgi:NADH:ubiquinone oxidoreductase subunit C